MTASLAEQIAFGPFQLDRANARLLRGGDRVALTPKALDVLHYLASNPDRLISKQELLTRLWPNVVVSDASVKVCVREIRKALGDEAKVPRYVETVHRRGYRFIGQVQDGQERIGAAPPTVAPSLAPAPVTAPSASPQIVGRDCEIAKLHAYLARVISGQRQVVFVTGGPGSGKTALVEAFAQSLCATPRDRPPATMVLIGHCFEQFGAAEPYMPIWEAMSRLTGQAHSTVPPALAAVLAQHAAAYGSDVPVPASPPSPAPAAPQTGGKPGGSARMLRELANAIESLAASTPLLLLLEDVHWADYSTLDLISALARRRTGCRLMLAATYRPTEVLEAEDHPLREIVQELRAGSLCCELPLDFLDESSVRDYLDARFPSNSFPPALARRLQQRTDGHPLFLVHLVDDLIEQGVLVQQQARWQIAGVDSAESIGDDTAWLAVLDTHIPQTVRGMIEVQLERLEPAQRQALEAAAVAGVEFSAAAVAGAPAHGDDVVRAEQACEQLARGGRFLEPRGLVEWPDGTVATHFRFAHELYHAAVYENIPAARRIQLHRAIGQRIESAWGDRAPEEAAGLAMHFEQGRDWPRAVKYLHHAADAATRQYAHREAVHYLRRALSAAQRLEPAQRAEHELPLLMSLGVNLQVTRGFASPEVLQIYDRAEAACHSAGRGQDLRLVFPLLWGIWVFHKVRSDLQRADEMAHRLLEMARQAGDSALLLQAHQAMCVTALCLGNPRITCEHMEQAAKIYDPRRHAHNTQLYGQDPGIATRAFGGVALWLVGRAKEAIKASDRAVEMARRTAQPTSLALALHFAAMLHQLHDDADACERIAQSSIELASDEGFSFWLAGGRILRGWARAARGEAPAAEEIRGGLDAWLATGSRTYQTYYLGLLADALLRAGRSDEAHQTIDEALAAAQAIQEGLYLPQLLRLRARCLLEQDPASPEAARCLAAAIDTAKRQGSRMFEQQAALDLTALTRKEFPPSRAAARLSRTE